MKKLLLSLGTFATVSAPLATVVACSSQSITDEQQKQIDKLTSSIAMNKLERTWLEKLVIDHMAANKTGEWTGVTGDLIEGSETEYENIKYNGEDLTKDGSVDKSVLAKMPHVQEAFKWFIQEELLSNSKYLTSVKEALDEEPEFNEEYEFPEDENGEIVGIERGYASNFDALGFNRDYIDSTWFDAIIDSVDAANPLKIHVQFSTGSTEFNGSVTGDAEHPSTISGNATDLDRTYVLDTSEKATEWVLSTLFEKDALGLVNELFKMFLVEEYLSLGRESWDAVFGDDYRDSNNLDAGQWTNIDNAIQEESDFPLIKFGIENKPFMKWEISVEEDDALLYAGAGKIATAVEADKHFDSTETEVTHVDETTGSPIDVIYPSIYSTQDHKTSFTRINEFGIGSGSINSVLSTNWVGYQGISSMTSQGSGNLRMEHFSDLIKANETDYFNGYYQDSDVINEDIELDADNTGTSALTKMVSLMPLFDDQSVWPSENDPLATKSRFTYDPIQNLDENGDPDGAETELSLWAEDKDLLSWYFYQMSSTDIWLDAKEFFTNENGRDFRLGITSEFVYNIYVDLGVDFIEKV